LCASIISIGLLLFLDIQTLSEPTLRSALLLAPLAACLFGMLPPNAPFKFVKTSAIFGAIYAGLLPLAYITWIGYRADPNTLPGLSAISAGLGLIWGLACHQAQRLKEPSHAIHLLIDLPSSELTPMLHKSFSNLGPSVLDDTGGATIYQLQTDSRYCIGIEVAIDHAPEDNPANNSYASNDADHNVLTSDQETEGKESCIVTFGYAPISTWGRSAHKPNETAPIDVLETMRAHFSHHLAEWVPEIRIQPLG
jgi:hypothetical protein